METTSYICKNCKGEFGVPGVMYERYDTQRPTVYKEIAVCPYCGADGFEQKSSVPDKAELSQYSKLAREIDKEQTRLMKMDRQDPMYAELYEQIENNKLRCSALLMKLQSFIYSIDDSVIRQIFIGRYINAQSWVAVALALGGKHRKDGVRMMHDRYLKARRAQGEKVTKRRK